MSNIDKKTIKIVLDAMGGDFAPENEVAGAAMFFDNTNRGFDVEIIFVGDESRIKQSIAKFPGSPMNYSIINASETVTMHDDPTAILKTKKDSSLYVGIDLVRRGEADVFLSAGNTGAVLSVSTVLLGRIKGVSRPTIGTFLPSTNPYPTLLVDAGANVDSRPAYLYEFAVMGSIYASQILGLDRPKIGLLSIGEEPTKGNSAVVSAHQLLSECPLNFIGNVEGRDILKGTADVVVCDGFTGNVILKFAESFSGFLKGRFRAFADKSLTNKLLMGLAAPVMKKIFKEFDYQEYGGVPLLGVNGISIIGHGKSSPLAFKNMIRIGAEMAVRGVNQKIEATLNSVEFSKTNH